jgi:enoyl-CoA hydratase
MTEPVTYERTGPVAKITMDDGKVNVMSPTMLKGLHTAFDRAQRDEAVVILTGRDKVFSAGFDLNVFARGVSEEVYEMMRLGADLALRVLSFPLPVVAACSGHALPMGAFLLLGSDVRIGADGPFRIGLNEVAIKLTVPYFAIELTRHRLTPAYFNRVVTGETLAPREAAIAGYLDRAVDPDKLQTTAHEIASALSQVDLDAHAATKERLRKAAIEAIRNAIDLEINLQFYRDRAARRSAAAQATAVSGA